MAMNAHRNFVPVLLVALSAGSLCGQAVRKNSGFFSNKITRPDVNSAFLSSPAIALPSKLNFFGVTINNLFVNPDGTLTFDSANSIDITSYLATGRPQLPLSRYSRPIMAPYWLFNGGGEVSFGYDVVSSRRAFAATWNVNPTLPACILGSNLAVNRFQVVLIERTDTGAGNFDIEFNYDRVSYDSLYDASGLSAPTCVSPDAAPVYAAAGFTAGFGHADTSVELGGSGQGGVFTDSGTGPLAYRILNPDDVFGRLIYAVRSAAVETPFDLVAIVPDTWPALKPNLALTARGTGFDVNSRIEWKNPDGNLVILAGQKVSAGEISVTVPTPAYATPGNVTITIYDNTDPKRRTPSKTLRITAPTTVTDFSPRTIEKGKGPIDLTVRGTGFDSGSTVLFGSNQATPLPSRLPGSELTVTIPAAWLTTAGKIPVAVRNADGYRADAPFPFEITEPVQPRPILSTLSPTSILRGSGDFDLSITGTNLAAAGLTSTVYFGTTAIPVAAGNITATQLTARVPGTLVMVAGPVAIHVTVGTLDSNTLNFTVLEIPKPVITSLSPVSIRQASADFDLVLAGSNLLQPGVISEVFFGSDSVALSGGLNTAAQLTARIPSSLLQTARTIPVRVRVRGVDSDPVNFEVTAIPIPQTTFSGTGINGTIDANSSTTITLTLSAPAPTSLAGTLKISFRADASVAGASTGTINPNAGFSSGLTTTFVIDSGQTAARIQNPQINVGSVAGVLTVTMDTLTSGTVNVLPSPAPSATITVPAAAAVIVAGSVKIIDNADFRGFTIEVFGSSSTRDIGSAIVELRFAATARNDGAASFTLADDASQLRPRFVDWFNGDPGRAAGGAFRLRIPFTTDADSRLVESVAVTLESSRGRSQTVTGTR
jgi:hypothetical protein